MFPEVLLRQNLTLTAHYEVLSLLLTGISFSCSVFQCSCSFTTSFSTLFLLSDDAVIGCGRTLQYVVEIGQLSESDRLVANPLALMAYFLVASLTIIIIIVTGQ